MSMLKYCYLINAVVFLFMVSTKVFANKPVYVENQVDFSTSESSIVYNGKLYFPGRDLEHVNCFN
ncbi:hypothetical protein N474_17755 [Pseudoalteromonas luteoviolacea CPMOR-2]|uniref:hypothetical protein n=1 Tax=Pseudoalteromonas luteoviolacea TaxID=43657 RepID=UPI0007B07921|nr:hypothetical protein [Pseudoalteromonas luteoviolacea]KZN54756.1 hypothetical protein N474_17755 [Pseudoalteromonas luteoviolacea CPMOR-2]